MTPPHPAGYAAPDGPARAELREKGSVFLAILEPVASEAEVKTRLAALAAEFPDATHHCWAARLGPGPLERASDAGEPAGTAGVPMLQVLRGAGLADVLAVVVRWYGGVKLGKGGLARAYAGAVREALPALPIGRRVPTVRLVVELPYERLGAVKRWIHPPRVELVDETYGVRVRLVLNVQVGERPTLEAALADLGLTATTSSLEG